MEKLDWATWHKETSETQRSRDPETKRPDRQETQQPRDLANLAIQRPRDIAIYCKYLEVQKRIKPIHDINT
jgi:hypothetical protein